MLRTASLILFIAAFPSVALAAWPNSPFTNLPLCTAANAQDTPTIVSDGAGGAFVTWIDVRSGGNDIYAQHVLASGVVDPAWPADGLAVCAVAFSSEYFPTITSDGAGGAIIAWFDYRSFVHADIYAQHVLASGVVDPAWPVNGRALCAATGDQFFPQIVPDGAGGAIVTWHDQRTGPQDIYAQHVLAAGTVDGAWPTDGLAVCTAALDQQYPQLVSDGAGGAIVTWLDQRAGGHIDVYAQRVLASGTVDPAWPVDGRAVCALAGNQLFPQLVSDGAGGAIITWFDSRGGPNDIYAHHVLPSGALDAAWPADGRALCTAAGLQENPTIVSDGAGGALVAWRDARDGSNDVYAQHVLASGAVDGAWPADGRALCTATGSQNLPLIVTDGAGGAIVTWRDARGGANDIYAQHVLASGAVDASWPADGRALCLAGNDQDLPAIVSDGVGGAIATWRDLRAGAFDIYAQRVGRYGYLGTPEAEIVSVEDVPNDQGGVVKVSWNASYLESDPYNLVTYYKVFRSVPPNVAASLQASGARVVRASEADVRFERPGDLLLTVVDATTYYWEYVATVNADYLPNYSYVAPTGADSTAAGAPTTAFMIQARTLGSQHWESLPKSGYSVDDLAPAAPAPFSGHYVEGTTYLHWDPNGEADLAGYRLYRGSTASFVPGPGNLVATPPDTGYADVAGAPAWYKLTAVDVHGNESPVATLAPSGTLAAGDPSPRALSFAAASPNPAGTATAFGYALPRAALVRLSIYDAAGRLVRELARGAREAGEHAERWDLRDAGGRGVGAGLYFAELEVEGRSLVRRVAVTR